MKEKKSFFVFLKQQSSLSKLATGLLLGFIILSIAYFSYPTLVRSVGKVTNAWTELEAESSLKTIKLEPINKSSPFLALLQMRRSVRQFKPETLSLDSVAKILWAAQGETSPRGLRTAPSAGGLFPLTIYLIANQVETLEPGVYRYDNHKQQLLLKKRGQFNQAIVETTFNQQWIQKAPAILVITAEIAKTAKKYHGHAKNYVAIEVGAAAQNIYLQATASGLGTTLVGAISDPQQFSAILNIPKSETPLAVMPLGTLPK